VKAYNDESDVVTTLVTGSIQLTTPVSDSIYKLQPNKTLVFDRENGSVECYLNKEYNLPMWYCDELNFNNITLDEISRELERRFKVKIVLRNPKCASLRFYASFVNGENVDDILSSLNVKKRIQDCPQGRCD
jgi:ferric-dicitrate binding protein FerR (iron transport regulator)